MFALFQGAEAPCSLRPPCSFRASGECLPVAAGAAAAKAAASSAETSKAATASGVAAAAKAATAAAHAATDPGPAAPTSEAAKEAETQQESKEMNAAEEEEDHGKEDEFDEATAEMDWLARGNDRLIVREGDFGVSCDDLSNFTHGLGDCSVEVIGAKKGDHFAAYIADLAIGENAFEAVADFNASFVVVDGQKNHDSAVVLALATHLPFVFESIGKLSRVNAIQRVDGDNGDLRVGLRVVELGAEAVEPGNGSRRENVGKVADVIGGLGQIFDPLSEGREGENGDQGCHEQRKDGQMCAAKSLHRIQLYV